MQFFEKQIQFYFEHIQFHMEHMQQDLVSVKEGSEDNLECGEEYFKLDCSGIYHF